MSTAQTHALLELNNTPNTIQFSPYIQKDPEFSADFSPETLTRVNAATSSTHTNNNVWYGIPQQWQDLACVPVQKPEIVGFRMGVNTSLSVGDLGLGYAEYLLDKKESMEVGSALGTADEVFWIRSTTRRPAPVTEWEFESRVGCAGKDMAKVDSLWEEESLSDRGGNVVGRKVVAVERLKNVLAHLAN